MSGAPWSPAEVERLRALARSGLSMTEIAKRMRRNRSSVRSRVVTMKIPIARGRTRGLLIAMPSERLKFARVSASKGGGLKAKGK